MSHLSLPDVANADKPETLGGIAATVKAHDPNSLRVFTFNLYILST